MTPKSSTTYIFINAPKQKVYLCQKLWIQVLVSVSHLATPPFVLFTSYCAAISLRPQYAWLKSCPADTCSRKKSSNCCIKLESSLWSKFSWKEESRSKLLHERSNMFWEVLQWCYVINPNDKSLINLYDFYIFNRSLSSFWYKNRRNVPTDTPEWDKSANILPRYGATSWSKTCFSLAFRPNTGNVSSVVCQPCSCSHNTLMQKSSCRKSRSPSYVAAIFWNKKEVYVSCKWYLYHSVTRVSCVLKLLGTFLMTHRFLTIKERWDEKK